MTRTSLVRVIVHFQALCVCAVVQARFCSASIHEFLRALGWLPVAAHISALYARVPRGCSILYGRAPIFPSFRQWLLPTKIGVHMLDAVLLAAGLAFFAAAILYQYGCERL